MNLLVLLAALGYPEAERHGKQLLEGQAFIAGTWTVAGYEQLWKQWGLAARPADFDEQFRRRYGLGPAPFPNHGLPLGLRRAAAPHSERVVLDCMVCHGGSMFGEGVVGLPNTTNDLSALFADLQRASGLPSVPPILSVNRTRGVNNAGALGVFFFSLRNDDLSPRLFPAPLGWERYPDLDTPAWWLLKKKKNMYCDAGMSAVSTRSMMQFMLTPRRPAEEVKRAEADFDAIRRYLGTIPPPKFPFPVNAEKAARGAVAFAEHCAECHGTYGDRPTYPGRIVPLDEIGTDPARHAAITAAARDAYNRTWFGALHPARPTAGYQAPPLDGVWATAPYFHNGSVPTLAGVLDPAARPQAFRLSPGRDRRDFDTERVGWKHDERGEAPAKLEPAEARRWFDTRRYGAANTGHDYGKQLTAAERGDVIEYLKTL